MIHDFGYTFYPMRSFDSFFITLIVFIFQALVYLAVISRVIRRREGQEKEALLSSLYALIALIVQSLDLAWRADLLPNVSAFGMEQLHWYSSFALSFLLLLTLRVFLQKRNHEAWWGVALFWSLSLAAILLNLFNLPDVLWSDNVWMVPLERLPFAVVALGWLSFSAGSFFNFRKAYQRTRQPLHRNRLRYWLLLFGLLFSADALFIANFSGWGAPFRLVGVWLLGYVVVTHHLPDLQQIVRGVLIYVATTLFASFFYLTGYTLIQRFFPAAVENNALLIGTAVALLLAIIFRPLYNFIERTIDQWMGFVNVDASETINEYSQNISNILDMERLANVTISLIMDLMEIQRGFLFLVDKETKDDQSYYALRAVRGAGERPLDAIWLDEEGPIANYLVDEARPLLQFDLDLLPRFKNSHPEERTWLKRLDAEVYVPIFAKREWIGLFALGSKLSGNRYTEKNLLALRALAGQTAVALENARLVTDLIELNKKVKNAYRDLEQTQRELEKIDRTKSDFISIASHELRTPLTVMRGYTEMLLESPELDSGTLKMLQGIHDGTLRLHEIMDSLFDIAQIDARTLQLELEPIDIGKVLYEASLSLKDAIHDRSQNVHIQLPPLPGIHADPNTLKKVFYHILSNAIKFTPDEGEITVRGKTLPFSEDDFPEGGIEIIISDTGIGIDPNFTETIFTKFYQPDENLNKHSTGKTKFRGSGVGLGLALSRGIVEAHGGKIWAESPGYDEVNFPGSHFHIILPLRKQPKGSTLPFGKAINTSI